MKHYKQRSFECLFVVKMAINSYHSSLECGDFFVVAR